ncbi:hypothetical protein C8J57DRAFT_1458504 [Mycena rebaudengoi]|nr:hypothetical protein C8J57DRAFT_1458504 [Mycena rebaudengoi]
MTLAGILDLPTEILARIFENPTFPTHSLYYLALLSRRLHFVALPIYFARNNINYGSGSVVISMGTGNWDILSALQSALFISTMEDITCILPHLSCSSTSPFLFHLARVRRFISRFPSVKKVTLQFASFDNKEDRSLSVGNDEALRAWTSNLGDLLNCILDRDCNSLTIAHGSHFIRGYELSRGGTLLQFQSLTHSVVASFGRLLFSKVPPTRQEFRRDPRQGREWIVFPAPMGSAYLTALHIQSAVLLVPPGLNWTLSVLRDCPITTLTISKVTWLAFEVWSTVLPLINSAAPNITSLAFLDVGDITKKDLVTFCTRFPCITHLELGDKLAYRSHDVLSVRIPQLRHLLSVKAPPEFLVHCLRSNGRFPKLQSVTILCRASESPKWITDAAGIARNLAVLMLSFKRRLLAPALSLSFERSFLSLANDLPSHSNLSDELHQHLDRVVALELVTWFPSHFFEHTEKIGLWIGVFRRVERVAITIEPTDDIAARIASIVRAMSPTKFMQTVEVNGRIYDLAGTVS